MPKLWGKYYSRSELLRRIGQLEQVAGVRLVTLSDGMERGIRVLEFRTGTGFAFDILVDRAFDIGRCELNGRSLGWVSGTGFPGPWFYEPEGLGFLRSFGAGLLTTCGLDHTLSPSIDTAEQYHDPGKATQTYGLHGRISNLPARLIGYGERWQGDECVLWAEGEVRQAAVFGEQLLLRRRVEACVGESRLTIHDEIENVGYDRTPHMVLYHVNVGFPFVDEGAELLVPAKRVVPVNNAPVESYKLLEQPAAGYVERVFEHDVIAKSDGTVPVGVVNRALGLGVYERFHREQLPFLVVWRMLGEGTYVVGIEPSTNRVAGRLDARTRGELIELGAGEKRIYDIELGTLVGEEAIDHFAKDVQGLYRE